MWTTGAANVLVRTLLTPLCPGCDQPLEHPLSKPICDTCWAAVGDLTPPFCLRCGETTSSWRAEATVCARCRRTPPSFSRARSAGSYRHVLRRLIHAFKYDGRRFLARPIGSLLRSRGAELLAEADAVVPVPLHHWRAIRRGFNQSDDLARELGLPVWRVLRRVRLGAPQAGLPAARRHANVRDAFVVRRRLGGRFRTDGLRGATVVLVDDVMTTGATANECSRVLRDAGVRDVRVLTAARASVGPRA